VKTISVRDLQRKIKVVMETAQKDQVIVTRNGKPIAVLLGIEGADWETVSVETSKSFWKGIRSRRNQKTVSLSEMRKRLGA
jgi:prevent-host-death family protein